ncbi:MAG: hypothetical protein ABIP42_02950, partial [Planctomycetota bacterium]
MFAPAVQIPRPGADLVRKPCGPLGRVRSAGFTAMSLVLCAAATLGTPAIATADPLQAKGAAPAAPAPEKKLKSDQLSVRSKRDGSMQLMTGTVTANNLDQVTLQVAGKDTKLDSELVIRISWGETSQSYKDGRTYLNREQFADAAAQFRLAAGDASSRDVVKASARLLAAQSLLRWGASEPMHFAEASEEAGKFLSDFAANREVPDARMLQARAKWMAGQTADAAQLYKSIYAEWKPAGPTPGYRRELCFEAGLSAARAMLASQPPDTLGARELFTSLDKAAGAALAALEPASPARARLARVQDEASLGDGFSELATGNSAQAAVLFRGKLGSKAGMSDTIRYGAAFGLAQALQTTGKLREAQLEFAKVSALEHNDRDRAAAAVVGLADTTLKLADPDATPQARAWLEGVT